MANPTAAYNGLTPVGTLGSGGYTGRIEKFTVVSGDSTAIFIGDPVKLGGTSVNANGLPTAVQSTQGGVHVGVCVGIVPLPTDLTLTYRKASTAMEIYVDTDPNTVYSIVSDNGGAAAPTDYIGANASIVIGSGSTSTGQSGAYLDSSTNATTNSLDLQILRVDPTVGNEYAATTGSGYTRFLVRLNLNQYAAGTTGVA